MIFPLGTFLIQGSQLYAPSLIPTTNSFPEAEFKNVEISLRFLGLILKSSQTLGFRIICLHYKPVSNHFCSGGKGGGEVKSSSRRDCE